MREGGKKNNLRKKIIDPFFEKVNEGDKIRKKHWTNFQKK